MISCRDLTRRFGDFTAVEGLSFDVPKGAITALVGPNGAGKSTTVKMLAGLIAPTSGQATIAGLNVLTHSQEIKARLGILPETLGLFDNLTVEEHLLLTGSVYGLSKEETRHRTDQILRILDLGHGRNTFADSCSHGMRKKTALAMALLPNPKVLILDEPFEAIDPVTSRIVRDLLAALSSSGITVFFTSHILSLVEQVATHILMMRTGRLVWAGLTRDLPRSLEETYFGLVESRTFENPEWLG